MSDYHEMHQYKIDRYREMLCFGREVYSSYWEKEFSLVAFNQYNEMRKARWHEEREAKMIRVALSHTFEKPIQKESRLNRSKSLLEKIKEWLVKEEE